MKKIVIGLMALSSALIAAGCSLLPTGNAPSAGPDAGPQMGPDAEFERPFGVAENDAESDSGSARSGSGMRGANLPEEARTLMEQMRSARESGDTAKETELRKELESKYPNMFGSGARPSRPENGSGSYQRGAPQSRNTDTTTRAS